MKSYFLSGRSRNRAAAVGKAVGKDDRSGESANPSVGRVGAGRRVQVHMQMQGAVNSRRVTASVAVVVGGTPGSKVWPLRRLRKLPYFREVDAAPGWAGRRLGEGASR